MRTRNLVGEGWSFLISFLQECNSAVVVTGVEAEDFPIVFVNSAFEKLTGYSSGETLGRNGRFLQGNDRRQPARAQIRLALLDNRPCRCVIRNYTKHGKVFWNRIDMFPLRMNGTINNFVSIHHDATNEYSALTKARTYARDRNQLIHELHTKRIKMERLSVDLINAQEAERHAVARELHDEFGQRLSVLMMLFHRARPGVYKTENQALLSQAEGEVIQLIRLVRNISASLRPPLLDLFGLEESVRDLLRRQLHSVSSWSFNFAYSGAPLLPAIEISIFRIVQESLTNIVRYAKASHVVVKIRGNRKGSEIELLISDDGIGFDSSGWYASNSRAGKFGIVGMSERVQLLGGSFKITSKMSRGTRIEARLPIHARDSAKRP